MNSLNELLQELGISKVRLAKYLNVSRQMVYNYLELEDINKWPKEKKILLLKLLDIEDGDEGTTEQPSTSTDDIMLECQIIKDPITGQWNTDGNYPVFIPDNESAKDLFSVKYYAVDANGEYILDENGNRIVTERFSRKFYFWRNLL